MTDARPLFADELMAEAQRATGLSDFGDSTLIERVEALAAAIESRTDSRRVRAKAHHVFQWLLQDRLRLFDDHARLGVADETIARPVIITGEARAGTTFAQMLFGQDPNARLIEFWEAMHPSPPTSAADADDNRRAVADADWREILAQIPAWLRSHPYNDMLGRNPPECERLWAMDFRNTTPTGWWRVPLPPIASSPQDPPAQYRIHTMMLKQFQFRGPPRHWVLKGLQHHHRLDTVLAAYPDAVIVWIHRDPVQALASRVQLLVEIIEGIAGPIDREAFAASTLDYGRDVFSRLATEPMAEDPRIHHVQYKDFTRDPVKSVRGVYERAGLNFSGEFADAMERWMAVNRSDRHGKFRYPVDTFATSTEALHAEFAPYRERFGIEIEAMK